MAARRLIDNGTKAGLVRVVTGWLDNAVSFTTRLLFLLLGAAVLDVVLALTLGLTKQEIVPLIASTGTAVSAVVAAIAAGQSREASRDLKILGERASEGLSRAIAPEIQIYVTCQSDRDPAPVRASVSAAYAGAHAVEATWLGPEGTTVIVRDRTTNIKPNTFHTIELFSISEELAPYAAIASELALVRVEFDDARGIFRWSQEFYFPSYLVENEQLALSEGTVRPPFLEMHFDRGELVAIGAR